MAKRYGEGKEFGEGTEIVDLEDKKNGERFIVRRGDIFELTKRLPYAKTENLSEIKYGVFCFKKGEYEELLTSVIPTEEPDEFKGRVLEGDILDMIEKKKIELDKIRKEIGEDNYQNLWRLPRNYLSIVQKRGIERSVKEEEEEKLKKLIDKFLEKIEGFQAKDDDKNRMKYLIEHSPYIFNLDLVIGSGMLADIKFPIIGISKIQGLIYRSEGFEDINYSNSGRYGADIIRFMGNYGDSKFNPLEHEINNDVLVNLEDERAQLAYLFFFSEGLEAYEDFRASSLYLTFLKPEGKILV